MIESETGAHKYYLSSLRSLLFSGLCAISALFMVWLMFETPCDSSSWTSGAVGRTCERPVAWADENVSWDILLAREFRVQPTWIKIVLGSPFVLICLFVGIRAMVNGLDGRPDFVISREGITRFTGGKLHKYRWEDISEIAKINLKQQAIFGSEIKTGWNLVFKSRFPGRPGFLGFVSKSFQEVEIGILFSETERAQIRDLARLYAPDIPFVEETRVVERAYR